MVAKVSSTGGLQWTKELGTAVDDEVVDILETSDGGYMVLAHTYKAVGQVAFKTLLFKLDASASLLWNFHSNQDSGSDFPARLLELASGDFLIAGSGRSTYGGGDRPFLIKVDSSGNLLWATAYDISPLGAQALVYDAVEDPATGDIYFTGTALTVGTLFVRTNTNGNLILVEYLSGGFLEYSWTMAPSITSGAFIIAGSTNSPSQGSGDLLIIEID